MKHFISILAICLLTACMGGGSGSETSVSTLTATETESRPSLPSLPSNNTFGGLLNNTRAANGAGAVAFDARLGQAAQSHADDMLRQNYLSHDGKNGSTVGTRVRAAGYNWTAVAENIAQGQQTEESVMQSWTNSSGHHRNNINPTYEHFGLGKAGSGGDKRWVLVLARGG